MKFHPFADLTVDIKICTKKKKKGTENFFNGTGKMINFHLLYYALLLEDGDRKEWVNECERERERERREKKEKRYLKIYNCNF